MKKRQIVNIVNFIRGIEPRAEMDLLQPICEQIALAEKYNFKTTFLIQYDALCDEKFVEVLKKLNPTQFELGVWYEIVEPQVKKAKLSWRGRFPWDWHAHCGFSVGYTKEEREILIDILFEDFKDVFGYYPKSFGSWAFDAHSLNYANERYGLDAACNCKEQWGTDGYNLWGGYYNQGYYPSKFNSLSPAQSKENQIDTPVFRMLGSDPIYQYDSGLDINRSGDLCVQGVFTLEPVYTTEAGGGIPEWVDWYLSENFNEKCINFSYTQAGQENSFGWEAMKRGLEYQFEEFAKMVKDGKIEIETMGETGRWFKESFEYTPATSIAALTDRLDKGRNSIWYNCRNYRINVFTEENRFWIRDIYIFREGYKERYLDSVCEKNELYYDTLPYIDGNRFSGNGVRGGLYPVSCAEMENIKGFKEFLPMSYEEIIYEEEGQNVILTFKGTPCGTVNIWMEESGIRIISNKGGIGFVPVYNSNAPGLPQILGKCENVQKFIYNGYEYNIEVKNGKLCDMGNHKNVIVGDVDISGKCEVSVQLEE